MVREPIVSGIFYDGTKEGLKKQIESMFVHDLGPGKLHSKKSGKKILAAVSPHAGYTYSGMCAAHTYKAIAEAEDIDTFIIISPNHTGVGRTSLITQNYLTPFGEVETDKEIAEMLKKNCPRLLDDINAHVNEHSLEVQLPFLQYVCKDFKIVPIVICSPFECNEIAEGIKKVINESNKRICLIASSDFTHYGPNYEYVPFMRDEKRMTQELDNEAIGKILDLDIGGFLEVVNENDATICGAFPIGIILKVMEEKAKDVKLLKYYMSSDVIPDKENFVSYASIVFYG